MILGNFGSFLVCSLVFISLGNYTKDFFMKAKSMKRIVILPLFFIILLASLVFPSAIGRVDWLFFIPFVVIAVLGTFMKLTISSSFDKSKNSLCIFLKYAGDNSLTILTWHFLTFKIVSYIIIVLYDLPIEELAYFPRIEKYSIMGWWVVYSIAGVTIPLLLKRVVDVSSLMRNVKKQGSNNV